MTTSKHFICTLGALLAFYYAAAALFLWDNPSITTDSISYYQLAKTFSSDFYRARFIRQYLILSDYGCSFPPLWPGFIFVTDAVTGLKIQAAYLLAFGFGALSFWPLRKVTSELEPDRGAATMMALWAWAALIMNPNYMLTLTGGDTQALALFLYWWLAYGFIKRGEFGPRRAILLGLLAGLACLNRFDFNLAALTLTGGVWWRADRRRWLVSACYAGAVFLAVLPWVAYSLHHFGTLYVADNSRVAAAAPVIYIRDYFVTSPATLMDEPVSWLLRVSVNAAYTGAYFMIQLFSNPVVLVALILGGWAAVRSRAGLSAAWRADPKTLRAAVIMLVIALVPMVGIALTGYFVYPRYYILPEVALMLAALMLWRCVQRGSSRHCPVWVNAATLSALMVLMMFNVFRLDFGTLRLQGEESSIDDPVFADVSRLLRPADRALCPRDLAARFSYVSGVVVLSLPSNWAQLDTAARRQFLRELSVSVLVMPGGDDPDIRHGLPVEAVDSAHRVWRVHLPAPADGRSLDG